MGSLFMISDREKGWFVIEGKLGTAHIARDGQLRDFRPAHIAPPHSLWEKTAIAFHQKGVEVTPFTARVAVRRTQSPVEYKLVGEYVYAAIPIEYWYDGSRCGGDVIRATNPRVEDVGEELPDWVVAHYAAKSAEFGRHHAEWLAARQALADGFPDRLREAAAEWATQPRLRAAVARWIFAPGSSPKAAVLAALEGVPGYGEYMEAGQRHLQMANIRQILADMDAV